MEDKMPEYYMATKIALAHYEKTGDADAAMALYRDLGGKSA